MTLIVQNSRTLLKRSQISGATPTVKTGSTQHTDGTWVDTEIYPGEIYWNMQDRKMYIGWEDISGNTGTDVLVTGAGTGSCVSDFYVENINACNGFLGLLANTPTPSGNGYIDAVYTTASNGISEMLLTESSGTPFVVLQTQDSGVTYQNSIQINDNAIDLQQSTIGGTLNQITLNATTESSIMRTLTSLGDFAEISTSYSTANSSPQINLYIDSASTIFNEILINKNFIRIYTDDSITSNEIQVYPNGDTLISALRINLSNTPAFADDVAAGAGGLVLGDIYETDGTGAAPLNVAGILMRKQ